MLPATCIRQHVASVYRALGSYRVYHTAGRMLILHRYSLRTGRPIGIMRKCGMRKVKCGMQVRNVRAEWCVECEMRKVYNQGVFMLFYCNKVMTTTIMMNLLFK